VLRAWQEIDDALNAYQAERVENAKLVERREAARQALDLAQARYGGGIVTWIDVLDARAPIIRPAGKAGTAMPGWVRAMSRSTRPSAMFRENRRKAPRTEIAPF
jgi:hypothetical protein